MFLPKKSKIFDRLNDQSTLIKEAALAFQNLTEDWENMEKHCRKLNKIESQADDHVHSITDDIEKYFILPLDKEDIRELTESLDDVVDGLEQTANRIKIYKLPQSTKSIIAFAKLISKATEEVHKGVLLIKDHNMYTREYVEIYRSLHDIEGEGDALHRKILEDLMAEKTLDDREKTTLGVMKWKEIFDGLEYVLDKCEFIAIIFARLRIKYS